MKVLIKILIVRFDLTSFKIDTKQTKINEIISKNKKILFSGLIKSCSISENVDSSTVTIVVANHWANWNLKKGRHFTDESQQQVYSGDKGLEFADQTKDDIRWGND